MRPSVKFVTKGIDNQFHSHDVSITDDFRDMRVTIIKTHTATDAWLVVGTVSRNGGYYYMKVLLPANNKFPAGRVLNLATSLADKVGFSMIPKRNQ